LIHPLVVIAFRVCVYGGAFLLGYLIAYRKEIWN
jgi:hypothetical protein